MRRTGVTSLTLVVVVSAAGCGTEPAPSSASARRSPAFSQSRPAPTVEMIASLQRREPVRPERGRNPFAFAQPPATYLRPDQLPPLPSAAGLPELPMPLPRPSVKLLGIAAGRETPPVRTAVLSVGGDLVLAHVGDVIAAQYRVVAISEDGIELADAAGQQHLRMALR